MLLDRLVCGVNNKRIQRRLLAESQLEFKKAMKLATAMETADKNTHDLQNGNSTARENPEEKPVNRVTKDNRKNRNRHQGIRSNEMQQENVFVVEANFTMRRSVGIKAKSTTNTPNRTNAAATIEMVANLETCIMEITEEAEEEEYTMFHMTTKEKVPYQVELKLNGVHTSMEVTKAAAATIINEETYEIISEGNQVKNRPQWENAKEKLRTTTTDFCLTFQVCWVH